MRQIEVVCIAKLLQWIIKLQCERKLCVVHGVLKWLRIWLVWHVGECDVL